jgi:hypothetical protein
MAKQFSRLFEDFICEMCSTQNIGDGFTNHCYNCLWSKHVDNNPGDRENICTGMMRPIDFDLKKGILHRCVVCKFERYNKVQAKDDYEKVLVLSALM